VGAGNFEAVYPSVSLLAAHTALSYSLRQDS